MGIAQFFSDKLRQHLGYPPTPCQERLFDTLADFAVQYDTCDLLLVSGYAGTGKTSAIAAFVKTLTQVWSVKIDGGEHVWPTEDIAGFNANELILDFFDQCS